MDEQTTRQGERPQLVAVDELEPCVPVDDPPGNPGAVIASAWGEQPHPLANRAQRRAAYERHKAADRDRRLAQQAREARRGRKRR